MASLEDLLKEQARRLGFALAGVAPAAEADGFDRLRAWLDEGRHGDMAYMERRAEARRHPRGVLAGVRSVLMVALCHDPAPLRIADGGLRIENEEGTKGKAAAAESSDCDVLESAIRHPQSAIGRVARYARSADYHRVMWDRLNELAAWLEAERPGCRAVGVCDTAPLLERDFARRAGLGWFGKNTMLLNKRLGSWFFLGALLTDLALRPDTPHESAHCGTCTACLDACPTQAFVGPGVLDARRCISYLTIELRGPMPEELRPGVGDWLFGCDVCQEVCPWNRRAPAGDPALAARAELEALDPVELLGLDEEGFRRCFRGTALTRAKRSGLLRNAAVVLGNVGGPQALPALRRALGDTDPLVREAAAWAIGEIEGRRQKAAGSRQGAEVGGQTGGG
jgi:epoxyqueuosine reductase